MVHELSKSDARRICVRAQLLDRPRPDDLLDVVRHLTVVQAEPTAPLGAPSADLVLWSRLGSAYDRAELADLIDQQVLIEHQGFVRPIEDIALFRAEMAIWPGREPLREWQRDNARWVEANDGCRREILDELRREGPLPTGAFEDSCEVPWPSSGWTNNRNVQQLLKLMVARGEVAAAGREGRQKLWDLAERVYPDDPVPAGGGGPAGPAGAAAPVARARPRTAGRPRLGGLTTSVRSASVPWSRACEGSGGSSRPCSARRSPGGPPCSRRSTGWSRTASGSTSSSSSTTCSRCTSRSSSGSGATTRSRSCTATGWSASSTPPPSPPRGCSGSTACTRTSSRPSETREAVAAEIEELAGWLGLEVMYVE